MIFVYDTGIAVAIFLLREKPDWVNRIKKIQKQIKNNLQQKKEQPRE